MRKIIDLFLTINLVVLACAALYFWWSGVLVVEYNSERAMSVEYDLVAVSQAFSLALKESVDNTSGVPKNGYEPKDLIAAFPGLVYTDFEGVEASVGKYVVVDGQLIHVTPPGSLLHEASGAISRSGFDVLLKNVSTRTQINLETTGTITQIMDAIYKK